MEAMVLMLIKLLYVLGVFLIGWQQPPYTVSFLQDSNVLNAKK